MQFRYILLIILSLKKIEIEDIPLPLPERFYLHKLIVSQKRQNPSKALKDLEQAKAIRKVLNQKKLEELKKNLHNKWKKID